MSQEQAPLIDEVLTDIQVARALVSWLERNRTSCSSIIDVKFPLDIQVFLAPDATRVVIRRKET